MVFFPECHPGGGGGGGASGAGPRGEDPEIQQPRVALHAVRVLRRGRQRRRQPRLLSALQPDPGGRHGDGSTQRLLTVGDGPPAIFSTLIP